MIKNLWVDSNPLTMEDLANKQEPLGADFQKVIDDNFFELAEATPVEQEGIIDVSSLKYQGYIACAKCGEVFKELHHQCAGKFISEKLHGEIIECLNKVQLLANTAGDAYYRFEYMKTIKEPLNKILAELGEAK